MGLFMHIVAKVAFVLVGYGIHMYLGKTLTPYVYGSVGVILSIININYNFLSNGARQAASHLIAANAYDKRDLIKKSYKYQMIIAVGLSCINFLAADFMAALLKHPELASYIRFTAIVIPFTALYFISVGVLNGHKLLVMEAITVTLYPLARLSIIPFVEFIFEDSVFGTVMGFLVAALVGCGVGNLFVARNVKFDSEKKEEISNINFFKQIIEFLSFFLCITIVLNMDMLFVNALVMNGAEVGYYTGATNFSKVSYYLLSAIYLVALPIVTSKYSKGDIKGCKDTINDLFLLIAGFVLPIVSIAGPLSANLMEVFYTAEYRQAGVATEILMISQFFLGMFVVINILICASQKKTFSTVLGAMIVLIDAMTCMLLIPKLSILGAALASLITNIVGVIVAYIALNKKYGNVWTNRLSVIIVSNVSLFIIMTFLSQNWKSGNFFGNLFVCGTTYFIFVFIMILAKVLPIRNIVKNLKKESNVE